MGGMMMEDGPAQYTQGIDARMMAPGAAQGQGQPAANFPDLLKAARCAASEIENVAVRLSMVRARLVGGQEAPPPRKHGPASEKMSEQIPAMNDLGFQLLRMHQWIGEARNELCRLEGLVQPGPTVGGGG